MVIIINIDLFDLLPNPTYNGVSSNLMADYTVKHREIF